MNFLAHLYLANGHPEREIGNFIADAIKGKNYQELPKEIQNGIIHHRAIDTYTDTHEIVKKSKRRLHDRYGHYKGVIIDIIYDHFLAKNWEHYANNSLKEFSQHAYQLLHKNYDLLPERTQYLLPFMTKQDWLYNYKTIPGISEILWGMNQRTKGISQMDLAKEDLQTHYKEFEADFTAFFKELQEFSNQFLQRLEAAND